MFDNPYAKFDFSKPFTQGRSRNLFGYHTTPRDWKHGARDLPFGMGAKSLHVDGTNGHDSNDGESWITAKKTIQEAVDDAVSWTQIFVKAGTYAESVLVSKQRIAIVGERRETTIITPATGNAMRINSDKCLLEGVRLLVSEDHQNGVYITGDRNIVTDCDVGSAGSAVNIRGCTSSGNNNIFNNILAFLSTNIAGVAFELTGDYHTIRKCIVDDTNNWDNGIHVSSGGYNDIYENSVHGCGTYGIKVDVGALDTNVYHNNLFANAHQVQDYGTRSSIFGNFYNDHTTDTNHDGICDTPYSFTGGKDYHPVSHRNGWKQTSLGHGPYDLQLATKAITLSTAAVPVTETLFTVTGEVEALITAYINTAVTSGGSLTLEAGIAGATAGLIAQTAVANLTIDKLWIDATPAVLVSKPSWKILANGGDIIHTIATAAATAGAITYYCWWKPLSADGKVVAA